MRKATRRKRYYAPVNPIALAISGACKTPESDLDKLRLGELSAIESFAKGVATRTDFRTLCDMLNLATTMAGDGIGAEALPACGVAEAAMIEAKARFDRTGRLGFDGPALTAVRDLYAWHDAQRSAIDRSTYERAIVKTMRRIRSAHPSVKALA